MNVVPLRNGDQENENYELAVRFVIAVGKLSLVALMGLMIWLLGGPAWIGFLVAFVVLFFPSLER